MAEMNLKEIDNENLEFIEAEFVTVRQSTVRDIEGGHVELQQVGVLSVGGERVEMTQSAATVIRGGDISLHQSMSVFTAGNDVSLNYSFSPVAFSRDHAVVNRSAVGILGAREVSAKNSTALMVLANRVEGDVTTLLDWRSALAFGAVLGGALGLISIFRKR